MTAKDFTLLKRIVFETAAALQRIEETHEIPDADTIDAETWYDMAEELQRAVQIASVAGDRARG